MKRSTLSWIFGGIGFVFVVAAFVIFGALPDYMYIGIALMFIGIVFLILYIVFKRMPEKYIEEQQLDMYVNNLQVWEKIRDFGTEIDLTRARFNADTSDEKYIPLNMKHTGSKKFFNELKGGKIYYGVIVQANSALFRRTTKNDMKSMNYSGLVLYSTDAYYDKNVKELLQLADVLYADKANNLLKNEMKRYYNVKVDSSITSGKDVYLTTLEFNREFLPYGFITGRVLPIIADPNIKACFVVNPKFWAESLIEDFKFHNKSLDDEETDDETHEASEDCETEINDYID